MQDFTAGGTHSLPTRLRKTTGRPEIDERIRELVAEFGCETDCELIEQLVMTSLKMARDLPFLITIKMAAWIRSN